MPRGASAAAERREPARAGRIAEDDRLLGHRRRPALGRLHGFDDEVVLRALHAYRVGRFGIVRDEVRLATAAAQVLLLAVAARARLLHPAGAAVAVEAFGVEPDLAQARVAHVR